MRSRHDSRGLRRCAVLNAVGQELVVSKIAELDAVDSTIDRNSRLDVTQLALPVEINVFATRGKVVADFVHRAIFVYKRIECKGWIGLTSDYSIWKLTST